MSSTQTESVEAPVRPLAEWDSLDANDDSRHSAWSALGRSFSWAVLGDVVYAACQWAMIVVLAKLGTPVLVGQFAFGLAVTAPVFMFANLQLRALQATEGTVGRPLSVFLTLRFLATGLAFLVIAGIALLKPAAPETKAILVMMGLFKAVEAVADSFHGELQRRGDLRWVCLSVVLKGVSALTVLALGIWWTPQLAPVCLAIALVWLLVLAAVDAPRCWREPYAATRFCWNWRPLKDLLIQALPLGIVAMLISLNVSLPRYFLESYWGEYELGVYSALAALMQASTLMAAALGTAASGRLGALYTAGTRRSWAHLLAGLASAAVLFGLVGLLVAWFGGPALLTLCYSPHYAAHHESFIWLMLAAVGMNLCYILNWAVVTARYLAVQMPLHLLLMLVTAVACWAWVPSLGVRGAALSVGIATVCQVLGTGLLVWHAVRDRTAPSGRLRLPAKQSSAS